MSGQVQGEAKKEVAKKDASQITFGGRPKFGRVKKNTFADFKEGIDDINENGDLVKKNKNESNTASRANAQENFINLGSGARPAKQLEESKDAFSKPSGVRPTFKGRLNLNKGEPTEDSNQGVIKSYDFKVSYSNKNDKTDGGNQVDRKDKRNTANRGVPFGQNKTAQDDDDFTFVSSQKRKRNTKPKNDDGSESEEEDKNGGFTITRGPQRA